MRSGNQFVLFFPTHGRVKRLELVSFRFWVFGLDFLDVGFEFVAARRHIKSDRQVDGSSAVVFLGMEV